MTENQIIKTQKTTFLVSAYQKISDSRNLALAVIGIIGLLLYAQTFFFDFTQYDDDFLITKNIEYLKNLSNIGNVFNSPYFDFYYRPFVTLSFMVDARLGGINAFSYHMTNVLLHIMVCWFVFLILKKNERLHPFALVATALFAVMPIATQAVAWIPGRNDSLTALFLLASFYLLLLYRDKKQPKHLAGHVLLFFFGLLTKEIAIVFPLLVPLYLAYSSKKKLSIGIAPLVIGWGASVALWWLLRESALAQSTMQGSFLSIPALFSNLRVLPEIIGKTFFPFRLSAYASFDALSLLLGIGASIILLLLVVRKKEKVHLPLVIFGICWFILFLLPSLAVAIQDSSHRFDYLEQRAYLSLFGLALVLAELLKAWRGAVKNIDVVLLLVVVLGFGILTFRHSSNFKNPIVMWQHITQTSPSSAQAQFILGTIYEDSTKLNEASACYAKAAELNPQNIEYHNNLGSVYAKMGNYPQAADEFFKSLQIDSLNPYPYHNLGSIYYLGSKFQEAEYYWKRAVSLQPDVKDPYIKLIRLYIMQHRKEDALYYSQLLKEQGMDIVAQVEQSLEQTAAADTVRK